ncbi:hypothetical protein MMC13_002315 [Lambiella insularis]|nr:hypothetical protein [Lambiella insularis]
MANPSPQSIQQQQQQQQSQQRPQSSASQKPILQPPLSPASAKIETQRVTLLLDINRILLQEIVQLQATGRAGPPPTQRTPGQASPIGPEGEADSKETGDTKDGGINAGGDGVTSKGWVQSPEYILCMRRLQSNLAYLANIADRAHKPADQIPRHPVIMDAPVVPGSAISEESMQQLKSMYASLTELYPDYVKVQKEKELAGESATSTPTQATPKQKPITIKASRPIGSRHLINPLNVRRYRRVQPVLILRTAAVHRLPDPIHAAERLMRRHAAPGAQDQTILPKDAAHGREGVLPGKFHDADGMVGRCGFVLHDAAVFRRVVRRRGAELDLAVLEARMSECVKGRCWYLEFDAEWLVALDYLAALFRLRGEDGEHGHVAVVVAEAEGGLREERVRDKVQTQGGGVVEVLFPQLHDLERRLGFGQLDHGGAVEEGKILRRDGRSDALESLAFDAEDFHREALGAGLLVRLMKTGSLA